MNFTVEKKKSTEEKQRVFEPGNVIVGMDLSDSDRYLLHFYQRFAQFAPPKSSTYLHIIPRYNILRSLFEKYYESIHSMEEMDDMVVKRLREKVRAFLPNEGNKEAYYDVVEGTPLPTILEYAKGLNSNLICIGRKHRQTEFGILPKQLVRHSDAHVLVVPDGVQPILQKILVPIDFSNNSIRALKTAVEITSRMREEVEIICLHAYSMPSMSAFRALKTSEQLQEMREETVRESMQLFISNHTENADIKIALVRRELPGIARYIYQYAVENYTDLVILGAKGHSPVERMILGSVSEKFLDINEKISTLLIK